MIKTQVIGYLGKDAVLNNINGKNVINFSVAHSNTYTDAQGNKKTQTIWVGCSWWVDRLKILEFLKKGVQVYVAGIPSLDTYRNSEGVTLPQLKLRVDDLQLLGSQNRDGQPTATPAAHVQQSLQSSPGVEPLDDLPF